MRVFRSEWPSNVGRAMGGKARVVTLFGCSRSSVLGLSFLLVGVGTGQATQPDVYQSKQSVELAEYRVEVTDSVGAALRGDVRRLPPVSAGAKSSDREPVKVEVDAELRAALSWALMEYRSAFVGRDLEKLESIWAMGAVERMLIKNAWSSCEEVEMSIDLVEMRVAGSTAVVDFDQEMAFRCPREARTRQSTLSASLEQNAGGNWTIVRIGDRSPVPVRTATAGPASLAPRAASFVADATEHRALETLSDYESALQRCDLDGLARVWIMTNLERQILQGLCFRRGRLEITISEPRVSTNDGKVQVDFIHEFTSQRQGSPTQTRSRLSALLIERGDGNMTIWKVRATQ